MGLRWKNEHEIEENLNSSAIGNETGYTPDPWVSKTKARNITFNEMKDRSVRTFAKKVEVWCPFCNAETTSSRKNINYCSSKKSYKLILGVLDRIKPTNKFKIKDVLKWIGGEGITDGTLQRQVLSLMTCLGVVKKIRVEFGKDGTALKTFRYEFKYVPEEKRIACKFFVNTTNKRKPFCDFNWKKAEETEFFDK